MNERAELTAVRVPEDLEEPSFQAFFSEHYHRLARAMFLLTRAAGEAEDVAFRGGSSGGLYCWVEVDRASDETPNIFLSPQRHGPVRPVRSLSRPSAGGRLQVSVEPNASLSRAPGPGPLESCRPTR